MATYLPFRGTFRYLQRQAHENPVIFFSVIIGAIGPTLAITVPPIRSHFGWKPAPRVPSTYPLPNRARRPVQGYEDEE
ncbi:hypothetical protein PLICRDRAFT_108175 [Plicaturopsis crispa FD-325 SS-3]|nr:hypothetical protein PLICRDRAFT_108175 [Plicaturopsis crispa FD-325 SS-3]